MNISLFLVVYIYNRDGARFTSQISLKNTYSAHGCMLDIQIRYMIQAARNMDGVRACS
jgi:hypothetical protein